MNSSTITLTGKGVTSDGITFVPGNGAPDFTAEVPEVIMWDDADEVTVMVTDESVYVTTESADAVSRYVSSVVRKTTCYRCPVKVVSYRVDFSLGASDDEYVPSRGVIDYGMFSDEGNIAVRAAVIRAIEADDLTDAETVAATVEGHPEVMDTVVREAIHTALTNAGLVRNS